MKTKHLYLRDFSSTKNMLEEINNTKDCKIIFVWGFSSVYPKFVFKYIDGQWEKGE